MNTTLLRSLVLSLVVTGTAPAVALAADAVAAPATSGGSLTLAGAQRLIGSAQSYARSHAAPGAAVAIVDAAGNLIALERFDGPFPASSAVSTGKARTAVMFAK